MQCIGNVEEMMTCAEEGVGILPGSPTNLELMTRNETHLAFSWGKPKQPQPVGTYEIRLVYKLKDEEAPKVEMVLVDI